MVARRDISKEIAVARLKFLVAPGRRAGDFASPAQDSFALKNPKKNYPSVSDIREKGHAFSCSVKDHK